MIRRLVHCVMVALGYAPVTIRYRTNPLADGGTEHHMEIDCAWWASDADLEFAMAEMKQFIRTHTAPETEDNDG